MAMIEVAASENLHPHPRPPPSFPSFPSPPLQWVRKKRLRCSSSAALLRRLPSPPPASIPKPPTHERPNNNTNHTTTATTSTSKPKTNNPPDDDKNPDRPFLRSRTTATTTTSESRRRKPKKKVELWISLSRDEIEEDYYSITGSKLPRRPKKRPRSSTFTALDRVFPGSWLPNTVTAEMYKVHEPVEGRRK